MPKPSKPLDAVEISVRGWHVENGVKLIVVIGREMDLDKLEELVRLTQVNTRLLLKLAVLQ